MCLVTNVVTLPFNGQVLVKSFTLKGKFDSSLSTQRPTQPSKRSSGKFTQFAHFLIEH
jgi:hypothetical protein